MTLEKKTRTLLGELLATPGPSNLRQTLLLFLKGVCMGTADVIPGVSGGTIALISGIYEELLAAIRSINGQAVKLLLLGDWRSAIRGIHLRFLFTLLAGIGCAIITLARFMGFFLQEYPVQTWGFFFGLIIASLLLIGRTIRWWAGSSALFFLAGVAAYLLMGLIPVRTPESWWFLFLSGMIAICAMILPGISGAFILLILGKYSYIIGMVKNPFLPSNLAVLLIFACGCLIGLLLFSRLLHHLLAHHHNNTMALLCGLMGGSLRKIWPWKVETSQVIINGKQFTLGYENILPSQVDLQLLSTCGLIILGVAVVLTLQKTAARRQ